MFQMEGHWGADGTQMIHSQNRRQSENQGRQDALAVVTAVIAIRASVSGAARDALSLDRADPNGQLDTAVRNTLIGLGCVATS
jgi:hypothetical protein